ncbi:hypothetical protein ACES2L_05425 [Bdellovibrio bacteriovorus]
MAKKLNLGCGRFPLEGWINLDLRKGPGIDVEFDLDSCSERSLPFENSSISEFKMEHVLEHIKNTLPLMQELHRVAIPEAPLTLRLPYGTSDDAWEDPTHVRPYYLGSFGYFSQPYYWRADYGYQGDWRTEKITLFISQAEHGQLSQPELFHRIRHFRNVVAELHVELRAVKPIRRPEKELQTQPVIEVHWI